MTSASAIFGRSPGPFTPDQVLSSSTNGAFDTTPSLPSTQLDYLNTATSNVQAQINSKQDIMVNEVNIHSINGANVVVSGDYSSEDFDALPVGVVAAYFPLLTSGEPTPTYAPWPQYGAYPTPSSAKWRVAGYTQLTVQDQPNIFSLRGFNTTGFGAQDVVFSWTTPNNDSFKTNMGLCDQTMICTDDGHYIFAYKENLIISHDFGVTWDHASNLGISMAPLIAWLNSLGGTSGILTIFERNGRIYLEGIQRYVVSLDRGYTWSVFDHQPYIDAAGTHMVELRDMFTTLDYQSVNKPLHSTRMQIDETGELFYLEPTYNSSEGRWAAWINQSAPGVVHFSSDGGLTYSGSKSLPHWDTTNNEKLGDEYGPMVFFNGFYVFTAHNSVNKRTKLFITKDFVVWTFVTSFSSGTDLKPPIRFVKADTHLYMLPFTTTFGSTFEYLVTDNLINWDGHELLDLSSASVWRYVFILDDRLCYMHDPDQTSFGVGEVRCWLATDSSGTAVTETERPFYFGGLYPGTGYQYRCGGNYFKADPKNKWVWFIGWGDSTSAVTGTTEILFLHSRPLGFKNPNTAYGYTIPQMWYGNTSDTCKITYMVKEK